MIEIKSTSETVNLWDETIECLKENGKEWKDVKSVIVCPRLECRYIRITKNSFEETTRSFDYHNGFGHTEVPESLKLVGEDWWMERGEYDGSEWWEFKTRPNIPDERTELTGFKDGKAMVKDAELVELDKERCESIWKLEQEVDRLNDEIAHNDEILLRNETDGSIDLSFP